MKREEVKRRRKQAFRAHNTLLEFMESSDLNSIREDAINEMEIATNLCKKPTQVFSAFVYYTALRDMYVCSIKNGIRIHNEENEFFGWSYEQQDFIDTRLKKRPAYIWCSRRENSEITERVKRLYGEYLRYDNEEDK